MSRRGGPRFAYRASALVEWLDAHSTYTGRTPGRTRKQINGQPVDSSTDARKIRRWRSGKFAGVTRPAAERLLAKYDLDVYTFEAEHPNAILRGSK